MANYDMTLPEIFVQLPEDIQVALEAGLNGCQLPVNPTSDQIFTATELITEDLKNVQFSSAPLPIRDLLDMVPQAVVNLLS